MTKLQQQIQHDWMQAMKTREKRKDTLSLIRNDLKNRAIAERTSGHDTEVSDEVAIEVLVKMAKQRRDSIGQFKAGGRMDLVEKETDELHIIESYLPKALTKEELGKLVAEVIADTGAQTIKDMGRVMGAVLAKAKGRVDGKEVQAEVSKLLPK